MGTPRSLLEASRSLDLTTPLILIETAAAEVSLVKQWADGDAEIPDASARLHHALALLVRAGALLETRR